MHYGNNRAPSAAPNERRALMSAMAVKCCDYLPALTDCGRFVIGDSKLRLDSIDHLPSALLIIEVEIREGVLQPVLETTVDTGPVLDWMTYIRPARDRHEQNVELVLDFRSGNLRLRTIRVVNPGDELLVWYSDQLALDLGVPVLSPTSIRGHAQYTCTDCSAVFRSPNPLKSHVMYHCNSPYRRTRAIADHAYSNYCSWYSMLPLLLPPAASSLPPTEYFRLMVGRQMKTELTDEHPGHDWSLFFPPVTSSSPPTTNYFRSPTCRTNGPGSEVGGRSQGQGRGNSVCWRPVCLDDKEHDISCPSSPTEKTVSYRCPSVAASGSPSTPIGQTAVDLERVEVTTTRTDGAPANRKPRASTATTTDVETGSRSVTSSRSAGSLYGRHECTYCGKRYSRRYGLTIHLRTHTGHKPLQCAVCLRPFGDPSNLNKHVRLHAGDADTPYRCRHCGKVLVRRRDLERHVRSRHPDVVDTPTSLEA